MPYLARLLGQEGEGEFVLEFQENT
jgi:hypothetical protein